MSFKAVWKGPEGFTPAIRRTTKVGDEYRVPEDIPDELAEALQKEGLLKLVKVKPIDTEDKI